MNLRTARRKHVLSRSFVACSTEEADAQLVKSLPLIIDLANKVQFKLVYQGTEFCSVAVQN